QSCAFRRTLALTGKDELLWPEWPGQTLDALARYRIPKATTLANRSSGFSSFPPETRLRTQSRRLSTSHQHSGNSAASAPSSAKAGAMPGCLQTKSFEPKLTL